MVHIMRIGRIVMLTLDLIETNGVELTGERVPQFNTSEKEVPLHQWNPRRMRSRLTQGMWHCEGMTGGNI